MSRRQSRASWKAFLNNITGALADRSPLLRPLLRNLAQRRHHSCCGRPASPAVECPSQRPVRPIKLNYRIIEPDSARRMLDKSV